VEKVTTQSVLEVVPLLTSWSFAGEMLRGRREEDAEERPDGGLIHLLLVTSQMEETLQVGGSPLFVVLYFNSLCKKKFPSLDILGSL